MNLINQNINNLNTDWNNILLNIDTNKLEKIDLFLKEKKEKYEDLSKIYPKIENIFSAFNYFNFNELKVLILGQDCYHQENQAHGLCFSVQENIKIPPSLKNIFKELQSDISFKIPSSGNLEYWAKQGILLLNSSLTVRESCAGSHINIWEPFTDDIISYISKNSNNIIFEVAKRKKIY